MIALPPQVQVFLYRRPTDMRKSFNGLVALTESKLKRDPLSGSFFVFVNRRRDRIKILYWGETGFCIWYQQLQRGTYQLPCHESTKKTLWKSHVRSFHSFWTESILGRLASDCGVIARTRPMPTDYPAIKLELLPHERDALLKWNCTPEVRAQLEACASSEDVETITITSVDANWLASDLTHAIVKKGCRDQGVIDLSERNCRATWWPVLPVAEVTKYLSVFDIRVPKEVYTTFIPNRSANSTYNVGTTTSVNTVEKIKPKIMPFVIGAHSAPPKRDNGNRPPTVVRLVKTMG